MCYVTIVTQVDSYPLIHKHVDKSMDSITLDRRR
jgi:hypothetical protein